MENNQVFKEGADGNVLAATTKQVSRSTIQLVLACQVLSPFFVDRSSLGNQ